MLTPIKPARSIGKGHPQRSFILFRERVKSIVLFYFDGKQTGIAPR